MHGNSNTHKKKWNWVGHTLRKEVGAIEKIALDWNPQGYKRRGRPKRTWQRTIEGEIRGTGRSWNEVKGVARDPNAWKLFTDALCSTRSKRTWWWCPNTSRFTITWVCTYQRQKVSRKPVYTHSKNILHICTYLHWLERVRRRVLRLCSFSLVQNWLF